MYALSKCTSSTKALSSLVTGPASSPATFGRPDHLLAAHLAPDLLLKQSDPASCRRALGKGFHRFSSNPPFAFARSFPTPCPLFSRHPSFLRRAVPLSKLQPSAVAFPGSAEMAVAPIHRALESVVLHELLPLSLRDSLSSAPDSSLCYVY